MNPVGPEATILTWIMAGVFVFVCAYGAEWFHKA